MGTCVIDGRPMAEPGLVCDQHHAHIAGDLAAIVELHDQLRHHLEPRRGNGPKVSGSRTPPVPLNVDVADLASRARAGTVTDPHGDQVGHISVAGRLDDWVRDWRDVLQLRETLPVPTVPVLAAWLRDRLDRACREHAAIDEFATEMGQLVGTLRGVLGLTSRPVRLAAPCPTEGCGLRALYQPEGSEYVRCGGCGRLFTEAEYGRLAVLVADEMGGNSAAA